MAAPLLYDDHMDQNDVAHAVPPGWVETMAESDADLAAGRIVPSAVVRAELSASILRLEAAERTDTDKLPPDPGQSAALNRP